MPGEVAVSASAQFKKVIVAGADEEGADVAEEELWLLEPQAVTAKPSAATPAAKRSGRRTNFRAGCTWLSPLNSLLSPPARRNAHAWPDL
jgi:hypothetical protein